MCDMGIHGLETLSILQALLELLKFIVNFKIHWLFPVFSEPAKGSMLGTV